MTRLQTDLRARIVGWVHDQAVECGGRLNEARLAQMLGVSRTPLRAALSQLEQEGIVAREPNRGVRLVRQPEPTTPDQADSDALLVRIARDRGLKTLAADVTEAELARSYGLGRTVVRNALDRLADLGMVERKPGYGWRFIDTLHDVEARAESYRFRIIIETAGILEPGFRLAPDWVQDTRARHRDALAARWTATSSVAFFEMNACFHEGVAACSGNRFILAGVIRQNRSIAANTSKSSTSSRPGRFMRRPRRCGAI
eukprot:gene2093-2130_t